MALGQLEQAVHWFECAMAVRPEDYQAPSLLGSALLGLGRTEEANDAFRTAQNRRQKLLKVEPGNTRALYFSALALCQLGERETQAIEWAERALSMDPDEPQVLNNVGCTIALLGHTERALDCLADTIAPTGWWRTCMSNGPDLASLHDHRRFQELVKLLLAGTLHLQIPFPFGQFLGRRFPKNWVGLTSLELIDDLTWAGVCGRQSRDVAG